MTDKKYLVICEQPCSQCDGAGILSNPIYHEYKEFEDELKKRTGKDFPELWDHEDEITKWWADNSPHQKPFGEPEEYQCYECEGARIVRREVDLLEALKEMSLINAL